MSGRIVWLASYPKSGNTWMRAIVTALDTHPHLFGVNQLGSGSQPMYVGAALPLLGIDPRWLSRAEIDRLRTHLVGRTGEEPEDGVGNGPRLRKTHEVYRTGEPADEPFPAAASRAAILIVRDPRDVVCSYAPFFGLTLDEAVDAVGTEPEHKPGSPANSSTAQPWGSWSSHVASWLDPHLPFPVHVIRYEDLVTDAVATLIPVFDEIGLECTTEQLTAAVERTRFERLQRSEQDRGFRETSRKTESFFRKGSAGGWKDELSPEQVMTIEADHELWMARLGYEFTTDAQQRATTREIRASRRRQAASRWWHLPDHMGIDVVLGQLPETLPDAQTPRPWIQVTPTQALVRFKGGSGALVSHGHQAVVEWDAGEQSADEDPSWIVQGWVVTLAMLQRGDLSLHAATVEIDDEVVAIAGHRGAGKSTTSMGLRQRGHRLLVDDVTLIEFHEDGSAWTTPYSRNVHLLPQSAAALGIPFDALPLLAGGRTKAGFRPEDPPTQARRIDRIVVLAPAATTTAVELSTVTGVDRFTALRGHTRRDGIAPMVLGEQRYFALLAQLAAAAPVQVLRRPRDAWSLDTVLDLIEEARVPTSPSAPQP